jgi:hypothetical protein
MMQKAIRFLHKEPTIWGPISLLCTLAIGVKSSIPFDLLALAAAGLFLSARLQLRGCCYSLVLLAVIACFKHAFLVSDHLWELGLEASLACAFFVTALSFEQGSTWIESLQSQMQTRVAAIENLEEELAKYRQTGQEQQIAFQEKVATLQKELEEIQADHSSILILNEVLRKTTARHIQENEALNLELGDLKQQKDLLKAEYVQSQKELERLSRTEPFVLQNAELTKELNAARYEKEQTHLINETLARLYARENLKAKEADAEVAQLTDQLRSARVETHDPEVKEHLAFAQEKVYQLSQIEPLFKQLKKQFEEKSEILHQVRSELFISDTELQKLKMERGALELNPLPKEVEVELHALSSQICALEEENQELQELISILSDPSDAAKRKKKLKTQLNPDQELLF